VPDDLLPWSQAWEAAGPGPAGFYRRPDGRPREHFRTAVMDDDRRARRLLATILPTLERLAADRGAGPITVTDAGADDGRLLAQLIDLCPPPLGRRLHWRALDLGPRVDHADARIEWVQADARAHGLAAGPGVVIAHELLDDIPLDVLEVDDDGRLRLVLVDPVSGWQEPGPSLEDRAGCRARGVDAEAVLAWVAQWWDRREPPARIEVGATRDAAWRSVAGLVDSGLAVAVDYAHIRHERVAGRWDGGTLVGYRAGRPVSPVPDGTCNLTAHVALDSCAAALGARGRTTAESADADGFRWLVQQVGA
jgi:hypothetical protein